MDKVVKNSTSGKLAYILRIVQFLIDAIKFDRTQIHFLVMFSLLSSLLFRKLMTAGLLGSNIRKYDWTGLRD